MPRNLNNWTFKDVVSFLEQHFFKLSDVKGSHHYFIGKVDGKDKLTWIPRHNSKTFPIRTLECAISKSGIPKEFWKKWANSSNKEEIQYNGAEEF